MSSDLREYNENYAENASLWFGKYKGIPIKEIPVDYLVWLRYGENDMYKKMSKRLRSIVVKNIPTHRRIYKKDKKINFPKNSLNTKN